MQDATLILLFSLAVSGQIKLRRIDGWRKIAPCYATRRQRHETPVLGKLSGDDATKLGALRQAKAIT